MTWLTWDLGLTAHPKTNYENKLHDFVYDSLSHYHDSYGGSNLLFMLAGVGILVSIAHHSVKSVGQIGPSPVESEELLRA